MWTALIVAALLGAALPFQAELRSVSFDTDPEWDGLHNRPVSASGRTVTQDFGYVAAGPELGKIGGLVTPDGKAAYYAKAIPPATLARPLSASGTVKVLEGEGNTLLGFFNSGTVNEWRTPNTIVLRLNGRGPTFHVHVEYATCLWRAGASVIGRHDRAADRVYPIEVPSEGEHVWSLRYDPEANSGGGVITATFDEHQAVCPLEPGHKEDGAAFNRFGLLSVAKHVDGGGRVYVGGLQVNGEAEDLSTDPDWEGVNNHLTYESADIRPRFDFGYGATHYAGGLQPGEIGGLFFRGDCRYPHTLAYYGDRVGPLTLGKPLHASGRIALRRAVSDSTTLFGFFHSVHSVRVNPAQNSATPEHFLGLAIEGPSAEGFFAYPLYRMRDDAQGNGCNVRAPRIYPDGQSHRWSLDYFPTGNGGKARIALALDSNEVRLEMPSAHREMGAEFDRFGFITPWIDGNGQQVYLDNLEYTCGQ